jgi:Cu(I)/Ag(I) efflux system membrane protein CusA/SilA
MFRPLAFTKTSAMMFASLLSITLVPVLMTLFIRGRRLKPEHANPVSRLFMWFYEPILRLSLRWRWAVLVVNLAVIAVTVPLMLSLGSEFMPPLYEGTMLYMPTAPPGLGVTEPRGCCKCRTRNCGSSPKWTVCSELSGEEQRRRTTRQWAW